MSHLDEQQESQFNCHSNPLASSPHNPGLRGPSSRRLSKPTAPIQTTSKHLQRIRPRFFSKPSKMRYAPSLMLQTSVCSPLATILTCAFFGASICCSSGATSYLMPSKSNIEHQITPPEPTVQRTPTASARRLSTRQAGLFDEPLQAEAESLASDERLAARSPGANQHSSKLRITRLFAPESVQNGTQNVTLDCMFKFDPKLDQRLTIKWFFEDELEPIYQWIPELNKRVYSDKYEHLIDKSYQVTEDVDWMLQAYKWLINGDSLEPIASTGHLDELANSADDSSSQQLADSPASSRKLLAHRLSRLAKLGGESSKQLLRSLRQALAMDRLEFAKYRALRLLKPTLEMSGRFTCSISSLESDDLQSTRLVVYEPPRTFSLNVSRTGPTGNQFNLTCRAGPTFPRPSLALFRYRAGQLEPAREQQIAQHAAQRPRLAATSLRQEPLPGTQTQLTISTGDRAQADRSAAPAASASDPLEVGQSANDLSVAANRPTNTTIALDEIEFPTSAGVEQETPAAGGSRASAAAYEIGTWTLVDESTLSSNLITQFECLLTIEGTNFEQRQTLALQKGWHVSSQALLTRSTLVGFMSVLASVLCLTVALVSALLVFKLMRRHANKSTRRVHHQTLNGSPPPLAGPKRPTLAASGRTNPNCDLDSPASSPSAGSTATSTGSAPTNAIDQLDTRTLAGKPLAQLQVDGLKSPQPQMGHDQTIGYSSSRSGSRSVQYSSFAAEAAAAAAASRQIGEPPDHQSDGIYRVPDSLNNNVYHQQQQQQMYSRFGTRNSIGQLENVTPPGGSAGWSASTFAPANLSNGYANGLSFAHSNANRGFQATNYSVDEQAPEKSRPAGGILRNSATSGAHSRSMPATISVNGKQLYC